jgi:hypothetical protein
MTREELHCLDAIVSAFDDEKWNLKGRNLLFHGVDGGGATNPADAFAKWHADGGRFITMGLGSRRFSREQLQRFAAIKAEALRA